MGLLQSPALPLGYVATLPRPKFPNTATPAMVPPARAVERVVGIEPTHQPWEGRRLPLHHTRDSTAARPIRCRLRSVLWEGIGMTWVYSLPLWVASAVFIGGLCILSGLGLLLVLRRVPEKNDTTHNDVAGPIMTTVGTVLAVLMSFMVVTVWQAYDAAAQVANREAADLSDLYHAAVALPAEVRHPIRDDIYQYFAIVIRDEWPLMREGKFSPEAQALAVAIDHRIATFLPKNAGETNLQADALSRAHEFFDRRRDRLFNNQQTVPALVWLMMFFVAAITIASAYFFRVQDRRAHLLMTVCLGAVIGATFLMIAELDLPFRGPMQIQPAAMLRAQATLAVDEGASLKY